MFRLSPNTGKYGPEKTRYLDTSRIVNKWCAQVVTFKYNIANLN